MTGYIIIGTAANLLRTYTVYRFIEFAYSSRDNKKLKLLLYAAFAVFTSVGYYIFQNIYAVIGINILGLFLIVSMYHGTIWKHGLIVLTIYSINIEVECLIFAFVGLDRNSDFMLESVTECVSGIAMFAIVIILEKTKAIKEKDIRISVSKWLSLISVPIISLGVILTLLDRHISNKDTAEIEIIGILIINMLVFYLYGGIQDYYKQKMEREEFLTRMRVYSRQLDIMKVSYEKTREMRHDLKHHMMELSYLANQGELQKVVNYLISMEKHMTNTEEYAASGNREIDGTLNYLLQSAHQTLKDIKVNISIPDELEIHSYMFNAVLGNLLENAIEAAKESEKKYLQIDIKSKEKLMYIKIQNSFCGNLHLQNGELATTKEDKTEHGIGLKSVRKMVEEMNGGMEIKWEEDIFCVKVMLYCK